jgi:hypothetical protein
LSWKHYFGKQFNSVNNIYFHFKKCQFRFGGHAASPSDFITEVFSDLWSFDFGTWFFKTQFLEKRSWSLNISIGIQRTEIQPVLFNNDIYVFGGFVLKTAPRLNSLTRINIHSGMCELVETKGEIPSVRSGHSCVVWKNFMFV